MEKRRGLITARGERTQEEIALLCGVKQQTYSHWETGRINPPLKKILCLERVLKTPKEVLFCDLFNSIDELKKQGGV